MFKVYIDDSGTAPSQRIAIASALILPEIQLQPLKSEWDSFLDKYSIGSFHTSECVHRNSKSEFRSWDEDKSKRAIARVRQITQKYFIKAFSFGAHKAEYDEVMPSNWRDYVGKYHYTWAVHHLLSLIRKWNHEKSSESQLEYIFDWEVQERREEIENAMSQKEDVYPGEYSGRYMFRHRKEFAGLQCIDLLAWASFAGARRYYERTPLHPIADLTIEEYLQKDSRKWLTGAAIPREDLKRIIQRHLVS